MSKDGYVQVPPNAGGGKIDCASISAGGNVVFRQRVVIGDNAASANFANVVGGALQVGGTIDKISATVAVSGQVSLGPGTSNIGSINNISATVTVAGSLTIGAGSANIGTINNISAPVQLAAGSNNIGTINNISANVTVVNAAGTANIGAVSLAAGTSNIGFINNISAPVQLAAGTNNIGSINNISANVNVVLQAGANNIGTVQAISAPVTLAAGGNNIGFINNISAVVQVSRANTGKNISDVAAVSLGTASSVLVLAAGTRFEARFYNAGSNPIALQAGTATFASAAIVLQPGDLWIEDTVPQTNWYGIAQTGASTATIQVVT